MAHLHGGPRKSQERCYAVGFTPSQGLHPRVALLAFHSPGPHPPLLPPPPCLLGIHAVHSRCRESRAGREDGLALKSLIHTARVREAKASPGRIPRLQRGQGHYASKAPTVHLLLRGSGLLDCVVPAPPFTQGGCPQGQLSVNGTLTTHLYSTSLPRGWSAPEATAAHAHSLSA